MSLPFLLFLQNDDKFITISVKDPQKVGDGISSFLTYNVVTRTNIGLFKKNEMTVSRRFSDFLGLHDKLAEKYLHKGRLVPAPPEKNVVGKFSNDFRSLKRNLIFFVSILQARPKSKWQVAKRSMKESYLNLLNVGELPLNVT